MSDRAKKRRYRIIGTLYLILALILGFQVELLAANWYDFQSAREMLNSVLLTGSRFRLIVAVIFGPMLHNTAMHLVENIGALILASIYIEYKFESSRLLYALYFITGWFGLFGALVISSPAVGASASSFGLNAYAAVISLSYFIYYLFLSVKSAYEVQDYFLPDYFLAMVIHITLSVCYFIPKTLSSFINLNLQNATSTSHSVGALMGLLFGIYFVMSKTSQWYLSH